MWIKPKEYSLIGFRRFENGNIYRMYISDLDVGYGYIDSVRISVVSENIHINSAIFEISNSGASLSTLFLSDENNTCNAFAYEENDSICTIMCQVPNKFNLKKCKILFKHNGKSVSIDGLYQQSGEIYHDFTDFCKQKTLVVEGFDGTSKKYSIKIFNLPILYISTPNNTPISDKSIWIEHSAFIIRDTDGSLEDYGEANVKGRGNWSWRQTKNHMRLNLLRNLNNHY